MLSILCIIFQALLWEIRHYRLSRRLEGHQGVVFGVDLDDSTQQAFTASGDKVSGRERAPKTLI